MKRHPKAKAAAFSTFQLLRMAAASIATDFLRARHRIVQAVLVVLAVVLIVLDHPWIGAFVLLVSAAVLGAYLLVLRVIAWVGTPRSLRRTLRAVQDDVRAEFERLDLPLGPIATTRFAWRLARGKRPHAELAGRAQEAATNVGRIITDAMPELRPPAPPPEAP